MLENRAPEVAMESLQSLSKEERLLLLKFVCAFAWADLKIEDSERKFVHRLVKRLQLDPDEARQVDGWLDVAPAPSEVDPNLVPRRHRQIFIDAARAMIFADGEVDPEERENLELLKALLA
jgi:tellurite resistance protein